MQDVCILDLAVRSWRRPQAGVGELSLCGILAFSLSPVSSSDSEGSVTANVVDW
jgi:hypothetical protein